MRVDLTYFQEGGKQFYATASYEVPDDTHNESIVRFITKCVNERTGLPGLSERHALLTTHITVVHNPDFNTTKSTYYWEKGNYHYLVVPD